MARNIVSSAFRPLVDFVYPPRCPRCGEGIAAGPGLCATCWESFAFPGEPACSLCQTPLSQGASDSVCRHCLSHPPRHTGIAAAALYNEPARQLVLRFKHGGRIGLAALMGRLMASRLADVPDDTLLIPVPLHRIRLWQRGYNQSALLARAIAKHSGHAVRVDALQRIRATPKLGGLGRASRAQALRGAIRVKAGRRKDIAGRHVILVDDVLTSGATSTACTAALLEAGAKSVRIACFARVVENETPGTETIPGAA